VKQAPRERPSARGLRVAVLRSQFNPPVTEGLLEGALAALREARAREVEVFEVPGAFELPLAARAAARSGRFDAVVALGAVIRGETDHYEHVARAAASGLLAASMETGVPVAFGVLTVRREEQAVSRAQPGPRNKGGEAARAAVWMVRTLRAIGPKRRPGGRR